MSGQDRRRATRILTAARLWLVVVALAAHAAVASAQGAPNANRTRADDHWVPTWGTAQQLIRTPAPVPPAGRGTPGTGAAAPVTAPATTTPAPAPATAPAGPPFRVTTLANQTVRMILRTSIGGRRARVKLSNAFGSTPVTVGAAHLAKRGTGSAIVAGTDRTLTFAGKASFTMMPGVVAVSDPVDIDVPAVGDVAVSLYLPTETGPPTAHATALHTTYVSTEGDFTTQSEFPLAGTTQQYYWVSSVEVDAPADAAAIVAFGDSITDGARSTADTNNSWPALLAARLAADKATANISVVNEGIGGNRLFTDSAGLAGVGALARLDRDVFSHPGVKWLMILEGINDIGTLG